jgi:hypothetical protein
MVNLPSTVHHKLSFLANDYIREPAKEVTPEQHADGIYRLQVYRDWLREKIFPPEDERVIAIMPLREVKPNYRDEWPR